MRHQCVAVLLLLLAAAIQVSPVAAEDPRETWYLVRFNGEPVGYEYLEVTPLPDTDPPLFSCLRKTRIQLKRFGQDLRLEASLSVTQTADGQLQKFRLQRIDGDGSRTERTGHYDVTSRVYRIDEKVNATRRHIDLRVAAVAYSPVFATWLPEKVLGTAQRATLPVLFPETAAVSVVTANRKQDISIRMGGTQKIPVRQIHFYPQLDPINGTTLFVTSEDRVMRQEKRILGGQLQIDISTADIALAAVTHKSLDLDAAALIPVDRLLGNPASRNRLVLDLSVKDGYLKDVPQAVFQEVKRLNDSTVRVTLIRPQVPRRGIAPASRVVPPQQKQSVWMPVHEPVLQRMATIGAAGQTDPGSVCRRLEQYVHSQMKHSPFSTGIKPADEIAKGLRGDCTEHAILLAALIRTRNIPSRIAAGIVHTNRQYGFVGHAWVEAWIEGKWIPFDSTMGSEGVGTTHLKLVDSELSDDVSSGVTLFLPVLDLAGRASIQVVEDR